MPEFRRLKSRVHHMSHNQNPVLKWSTQNHVKKNKLTVAHVSLPTKAWAQTLEDSLSARVWSKWLKCCQVQPANTP